MIWKILVAATLLVLPALQQAEPTVRIGLGQNPATVTIRSSEEFRIQGQATRSARFAPALGIGDAAEGTVLNRDQLRYRMTVEIDGNRIVVLPMANRVRIQPSGAARLQINDRSYRGILEVFGNARNTFTIVNELPLEEYLLGVVPNELSPSTFGQLEALKAQAVAARTYIVKNMGQYKADGYDICDTDACQVYFGAGTEDPLSTRAVVDTRGMIATYAGQPINALYSSTCGGRTESSENIFTEKLPYLVSVMCVYKHPEPKSFTAKQRFPDFKSAVLGVAGVSNFTELRRFLGISGTGEPPSNNLPELAKYLRETYYPNTKPSSDLDFMVEQDILPSAGSVNRNEVLYRMIDRKGAFEWQQGVLNSWDGQTLTLAIAGKPTAFRLNPDAPIYFRMGEERTAMTQGGWIGGELFDFRAVDGVIQMAVYRRNFVNSTADRYSRLALWQVHKTKQEIDTAFRQLNIGETRGIRVIERGASERPISTEITGTQGKTTVRALRLRTLLGLRDSMFYFDEERNSKGDLIGMTFYGSGWGHGVGMCQVGAFGMAMDGARYDEILKTYYTGIDLRKMY
ncbi:MAG TPA: SpoIID/LytB domain-containing protein [Terriglobia bacterium]|nr:SpoIID/LytB domain-containing protein [Terriglobia bacterium]